MFCDRALTNGICRGQGPKQGLVCVAGVYAGGQARTGPGEGSCRARRFCLGNSNFGDRPWRRVALRIGPAEGFVVGCSVCSPEFRLERPSPSPGLCSPTPFSSMRARASTRWRSLWIVGARKTVGSRQPTDASFGRVHCVAVMVLGPATKGDAGGAGVLLDREGGGVERRDGRGQ